MANVMEKRCNPCEAPLFGSQSFNICVEFGKLSDAEAMLQASVAPITRSTVGITYEKIIYAAEKADICKAPECRCRHEFVK